MGGREAVRIALQNIRANKLRAFFTVLGTVVGVTFLIAVITLLKGMDAYMKEEFAGRIYGHNTVLVRRVPEMSSEPVTEATWREWMRRPLWTHEDAEWLAANVRTPGMLAYAYDETGRVSDGRGREVSGVRVVGGSANWFAIRDLEFEAGRPFSRHEADRGVAVVVLGRDVADPLFPGRNPVGQTVRIHGFPYRVVGVMEKQGTLFGMSMDRVAIVPIKGPANGALFAYNSVEDISFKVPETPLMEEAQSELIGLGRTLRGLRPAEENNFSVETAESSLGFWNRVAGFMLMALPALVSISLLVGAVVIMNIMLVSVSQRTREIGIRKSLGARRKDVLMQFMIEAGTLSGVGGLVGIGLGIGLAQLVTAISPLPARVSGGAIALAIFLGIGVGLAAGVYPAWRASRLDPIVALRSE
ncbi:MAG TPA: ABC transporter permease [Longimicrobium sp.]|nr:ABC transporter permease [Longimicrobium sp.]